MEVSEFKGPILVSVVYCLVYYGFLLNIMRTRISCHKKYQSEGKKFDRYFGQDRNMLAADRIQLNMLEQMPIFLLLLWLHAIFISTEGATLLGSIYTGSRAIYPFLIGGRIGKDIPMRVLVSTMIGYGVIFWFMFNLVMKVI